MSDRILQGRLTEYPKEIMDHPEILPCSELYYTAFQKLTTCRQFGFDQGPIPWTAIDRYAERMGMDEDEFWQFEAIICRIDTAYMQAVEDNRPKPGKGRNKNARPSQGIRAGR